MPNSIVGKVPSASLTSQVLRTDKTMHLGDHTLTAPMMWLGHDLKSRLCLWDRVQHFPGILISAHQILMPNRSFFRNSSKKGLHSYLGYDGPIFLDSGGFHFQQDGSASMGLDELLSAQVHLRPDLAAVLDLPLHPQASSRENARRWCQTLRNTEQMLKHREQLRLALVLHVYNLRDLNRRCQELRNLDPNPTVVCVGSLV